MANARPMQPGQGHRARLRAATSEVHTLLDTAPLFAALAAGTLDRGGYAEMLTTLGRFHLGMEPVRQRGAAALGLPVSPKRLDLLRADLAAAGATATPCPPIGIEGPEQSIGALWVVEGSAVGGRLLNRQLDALFGEELAGRRFFAGTPAAPEDWRCLCRALDDYRTTQPDELVVGAQTAFRHFENLLGGAN